MTNQKEIFELGFYEAIQLLEKYFHEQTFDDYSSLFDEFKKLIENPSSSYYLEHYYYENEDRTPDNVEILYEKIDELFTLLAPYVYFDQDKASYECYREIPKHLKQKFYQLIYLTSETMEENE